MQDVNWAVLAAATLMVLFLSQACLVLTSILHLANVKGGTWREDITPYAHKIFYLFPLAAAMMAVLLMFPEKTFPYYGKTVAHMSPWLNYSFLVTREAVMMLLVAATGFGYIRASDRHRREFTAKTRDMLTYFSSAVITLYVLYATVVSWDFEMTLTMHWHSAIYSAYFFVSSFGMFLAFFVVSMYILRVTTKGTRGISDKSFNALAQLMLGFTLLWTYTFFSQFLTIWYAALPGETKRLFALMFENADIRRGPSEISVFFWTFVLFKSFGPFFMLIFSVFRHTPALTAFVGLIILTGTFLERFTWAAATYKAWNTPLSGLFDIVVVAGVVAIMFAVLRHGYYRAASLNPVKNT